MTSDKAPDAFRTISEAAEDLGLEQHVLRFWETRFTQIKPLKRGGGRRYYRPDDVDFLRGLRHLLHDERYTIKGVQKIIKEQGVRAVIAAGRGEEVVAPKVVAPGLVRSAVAQPRRSVPARPAAQPVQPTPLPPIVLPDNAGWRDRLEAAMSELVTARQVLASV